MDVDLCQEQIYTSLRLPSPEPQPPAESLSMSQNFASYNQVTVSPHITVPVIHNYTPKLAPIRTYTRKKAGTVSKAKPSPPTWSPLQKKKTNSTVSSTKVPNPTMKLEVRKRRLILDPKTTLAAYDPTKVEPVIITKKKIIRKQVTGKTRKQFEALKVTAFDLLTNPSVGHMTQHLNKQFQESCVNKVTTTVPNYAEIAVASTLIMDRQVKSLVAAQKRMEQLSQRPKCRISRKSKVV
ncbi:hypothetical protein M5D96_011438 [Drosophila gunungcola]|uniref:Uncharacterized protein n=2 Tax=Drosophila gunungcola TaxID=103775 RepID=A0A9P9YEV4_9MUSC|nr:hypothetical protein M5D96_011438 [Drosophila gunungcola]